MWLPGNEILHLIDDAQFLATLPGLAFAFVLVLSRTGMVVMLLPGLGEVEPPPVVRAGLTLALTALVLPGITPLIPPTSGIVALGMIVAELGAGAMLGWLARLPAMALTMAGAIISYMLGLSSVVQPDPALGGQSAALARLFGLIAPVLILSTGLYALPLSALAGSYQLIGPGELIPAGPLAETVTSALAASFVMAVQLAAPFILVGSVFQVALGLLARLVPQLQAYTAAIPGQILGGLFLLMLVVAPLLGEWTETIRAAWSALPGL